MTRRRADEGEVLTQERLREVLDYDPETGIFRWKVRRKGARADVDSEQETGKLTWERLTELLDYDGATGIFTWKIKPSRRIVVGSEAGAVKNLGARSYRYIRIDGVGHLAQRLAWFWAHKEWPYFLRFENEDTLDCSISNLRDTGNDAAGKSQANRYRYIRIDGVDYLAQRLAWFWVNGTWPEFVRFNDDNPDNCAISNLRDAAFVRAPDSKYDWRTKEGRSAQRKEYYKEVRDRVRGQAFKTKFGIGLEDYQRMEQEQNGVCAICGKPETIERNGKPRWMAVDHCHDTGKVRGLLCGRCNPMIGYADHSIEILTRAIDYLRRTNGGNS